MPQYFFHSQTDSRFTDDEGSEHATASQARAEAIRLCGEMLRDAPEPFWGSRPWSVTVTNAAGLIMWEIYIDGVSSPAGSSQ
jgi:hypothetical protein